MPPVAQSKVLGGFFQERSKVATELAVNTAAVFFSLSFFFCNLAVTVIDEQNSEALFLVF